MTSCDRSHDYGIVNYPICSGHGWCDDGLCMCYHGWTGFSDLELVVGFDCDINLSAVQIWAIIDLVLTTFAIFIIIYCILREKAYIKNKRYTPKSACFVSFLCLNFFGILHAIEKIYNPRQAIIGRNTRVEVWALGITSMTCFGISYFFIVMITFLKSYSRLLDPITRERINSNVDFLVYLAPKYPIVFLIVYAGLLFPVNYLPNSDSDKFNIGGCVTYTLGYCYYSFTVLYVIHVFIREVGNYLRNSYLTLNSSPLSDDMKTPRFHSSSNDMKTPRYNGGPMDIQIIYDKIILANRFITPFLVSGAPLNIIFASWIYLRRKLVFLLLFELALVSVMSICIVWSLTSVRKENVKVDVINEMNSPHIIQRRVSLDFLSPNNVRITPFATPSVTPRIPTLPIEIVVKHHAEVLESDPI